jgi:hypothetical protein
MCDGCLWSVELIGLHSQTAMSILHLRGKFTSSCKSIEEYVGEISVTWMSCHFITCFLGWHLESLSKMLGIHVESDRLIMCKRRKGAFLQKSV